MMARYYPAIVEADSDGYSVFFPDVPGCTSGGATLQQAAQNAEEALQAHVTLSQEHGDELPEPSELDTAVVDADIHVAARFLVRVESAKSKQIRVNVMLPSDLLAAADRFAAHNGYTRSGLLAQAIRDKLRAVGEDAAA